MSDLISRQAAIDAIVNTVSEIGLHDDSEVARYGATFRQHEIIDIIEGLPPAQPTIEPRKGEWVKVYHNGRKTTGHIECSICGWWRSGDWTKHNFCPNCGADMREEDHNEP